MPPPPSAADDEAAAPASLETLWAAYCAEARAAVSAEAVKPILSQPLDDGGGRSTPPTADLLIPVAPSIDPLDDAPLPPAILDSERGEVASQAEYILQLEKLLVGAGLTGGGTIGGDVAGGGTPGQQQPEGASGAVALRQENRMLRAKTLMLERQLQQSHARCRRAEQVNAKWRTQLGAVRQREREGWEALQTALKKAERAGELQRHNQRLRETLQQRSDQLIRSGQRVAELELMLSHMKDALGKAMGNLRPEALDALT